MLETVVEYLWYSIWAIIRPWNSLQITLIRS